MNDWPRCTQILKDEGIIDTGGDWYYQPKHLRRGRLVDAACNILGAGRSIEPDWWAMTSGERDDDRVPHTDCRPYIDAYATFLRETGFRMTHCAVEVRNAAYRYIGHIDQLGLLPARTFGAALIDIKTGGESDWHRLQLGGYKPAVIQTIGEVPDRFNLYLTNDGKYRLVCRNNPRDVSEFAILAQAWHIKRGFRK